MKPRILLVGSGLLAASVALALAPVAEVETISHDELRQRELRQLAAALQEAPAITRRRVDYGGPPALPGTAGFARPERRGWHVKGRRK